MLIYSVALNSVLVGFQSQIILLSPDINLRQRQMFTYVHTHMCDVVNSFELATIVKQNTTLITG